MTFWIPFYKILQETKGDIKKADPRKLQSAVKENTERGEDPTRALMYARDQYEKNPNLNFK